MVRENGSALLDCPADVFAFATFEPNELVGEWSLDKLKQGVPSLLSHHQKHLVDNGTYYTEIIYLTLKEVEFALLKTGPAYPTSNQKLF